MPSLKTYDETDARFNILAHDPVVQYSTASLLAALGVHCGQEAIQKSGESLGVTELLPFVSPVNNFKKMLELFCNVEDGHCTKEESYQLLKSFIQQESRRAVTQVLASRKKQAA